MVEYIIFKAISDSVDPFILYLAELGVVLGAFSAGASILLLTDYVKRHGWQYKHKKKVVVNPDPQFDVKRRNEDWAGARAGAEAERKPSFHLDRGASPIKYKTS